MDLKHLGKQSSAPLEAVELVEWTHGEILITFNCTEFSSLCPVTQMPDYGTVKIGYVPTDRIIETKSLKLFLMNYRTRKDFNEVIIADIAEKLFAQVQPSYLTVEGFFNIRGGISVNPKITKLLAITDIKAFRPQMTD